MFSPNAQRKYCAARDVITALKATTHLSHFSYQCTDGDAVVRARRINFAGNRDSFFEAILGTVQRMIRVSDLNQSRFILLPASTIVWLSLECVVERIDGNFYNCAECGSSLIVQIDDDEFVCAECKSVFEFGVRD